MERFAKHISDTGGWLAFSSKSFPILLKLLGLKPLVYSECLITHDSYLFIKTTLLRDPVLTTQG